MTNEQIAELRRLHAASTQGEWERWDNRGKPFWTLEKWNNGINPPSGTLEGEWNQGVLVPRDGMKINVTCRMSPEDCQFIVGAHSALPALLDEREADKAEIERLKTALAEADAVSNAAIARAEEAEQERDKYLGVIECSNAAAKRRGKERDIAIARAEMLEAALREIIEASRLPFGSVDSNGDCTLMNCHCSNHIARAAIRAARGAKL